MHTANAVPSAAGADFISINGAALPGQNSRHGHHVHHHHHQRHFQQHQPEQHTSNRFKRKREGSGEPTAGGGEALPEVQLRQSPQEMESPALRSPWVPPGKSYVTGILG